MPAADRTTRAAVAAALAGWLVAAVAGQHPALEFHRVRRADPLDLLVPRWRFFAPTPMDHDVHLVHRTVGADGSEGPWLATSTITPRRLRQAIWFPERRREKALVVTARELAVAADGSGDETARPEFRLLRGAAALAVRRDRPRGPLPAFRFALLMHTGHDRAARPRPFYVSPVLTVDR